MVKMIRFISNKLDDQSKQLKQLRSAEKVSTVNQPNEKFNSYADCVKDKMKEHPVIIKSNTPIAE
jgi:hypothetical protein